MYNEGTPYSRLRGETELVGQKCPRCGSHLECNRSHEGFMFYCSQCGFSSGEYDRPRMFLGGI